jgi:disulfide oxidoreductase YuzD
MNSIQGIRNEVISMLASDPSIDDFKKFTQLLKDAAEVGYAPNTKFTIYSFMRTHTKRKYTADSDQYRHLIVLAKTPDEKKEIAANEATRLKDKNSNITTFTNGEFNSLRRAFAKGEDVGSQILHLMLLTGARTVEILSDKYKFSNVDKHYIKQDTAKSTKAIVKPLLGLKFSQFNILLEQLRAKVDQKLSNVELNQKYASVVKNRLDHIKNKLVPKSHSLRSIYTAYVIRNFPSEKISREQYTINLLGHNTSGSLLNYTSYKNV